MDDVIEKELKPMKPRKRQKEKKENSSVSANINHNIRIHIVVDSFHFFSFHFFFDIIIPTLLTHHDRMWMLLYTEKKENRKKASTEKSLTCISEVAMEANKQASKQRGKETDQISKLKLKVFFLSSPSFVSQQE